MYLFDRNGRLPAEGAFIVTQRDKWLGGFKACQVLPSGKLSLHFLCGAVDLLGILETGGTVIYAKRDGF